MELSKPGMLEWVAVPFSRNLPNPGIEPGSPALQAYFFTSWATREAQEYWSGYPIPSPVDLPNLWIALQVASLPAELPGKPQIKIY